MQLGWGPCAWHRGAQPTRQCSNGAQARPTSLPRRRSSAVRASADGVPAEETTSGRSGANIYAHVFKAMKATSSARSELERELFGASTSSSGASGAAAMAFAATAAAAAAPPAPVPTPSDSTSPLVEQQRLIQALTGTGVDTSKSSASLMRGVKSWKEAKEVLAAAEKHTSSSGRGGSSGGRAGVDAAFLDAVFTTLPKLLRKQQRMTDSERQEVLSVSQELIKQHLPRLVDDLDATGLTAVAVGLAKVGYTEPLAFQELARHSVPHMQAGTMSATMLSNLAWALATAGVRPCGAWLSEFWMELEDQVDALSGQDIANIFWSICRLDLMPPWVAEAGGGPMSTMLVAALQRVGSTPSGQDPATVMVCLAIWSRSYSYHPPEDLLNQMLASMQPHLPRYLPQDLVSIVHSLVVLNANPSRAWMTDFYTVLRDRLIFDPTLSLADFQRLLWALSRIDYIPSQAWLRQFVEVSVVKLRHLRFRALSELVWALACWGYTPTQEWLDEYFRCTLHKLSEYRTQHLANSILALKKLGCKVPSPWLDAALVSFCAQLDSAQAHDLITFIDGIVDVCDDAAWMSRPTTARSLRSLAAFAASKFDICDQFMHAKLLIALATAKCFPGPAWLSEQQVSLAKSLGDESEGDKLDTVTAGNLRAAYAAWDVPLNPSLGAALGEISDSSDAR